MFVKDKVMRRKVSIIIAAILLGTSTVLTVSAESGEEVFVIGEDIAEIPLDDEGTAVDLTDVGGSTLEFDYESIYDPVLDGIIEDGTYVLCDIDDDGTKEMIVGYGSTADYVNMVWTVIIFI